MEKIEIRSNTNLSINEETLLIEGLVNKTESWSNILGNRKKFREKISRGVFTKALAKAKTVDFLYDHNKTLILSTTDNNSLVLWEDEEGLQMRAEVSKTSYGQDAYVLIKDKIINHMSFGFRVVKERWNKGLDGIYERIIDELELSEVSAVRNPAYSQSAIEARGIEVVEDVEIPDIEDKKLGERDMDFNIEELKKSLKAELLVELQNMGASTDVQISAIEKTDEIIEVVNEVVEEKTKEEEIKTVIDKSIDENVKVKVSESVEVTKTEEFEDGSVKETSDEVKVEKVIIEPEKKFDVINYVNAIKENQKNRL